jgi:hypothetical protein
MVGYVINPFHYLKRLALVGSAKVLKTFYFASFRVKNFLVFLSVACCGGFQLKRAAKVRSFFSISKLEGEIFKVSRFASSIKPTSIKLILRAN